MLPENQRVNISHLKGLYFIRLVSHLNEKKKKVDNITGNVKDILHIVTFNDILLCNRSP